METATPRWCRGRGCEEMMISLQVAGAAPAPQPWPSRPLISTWSDVLAARNWGHEWCLEVDYSEQQIWRWNGRIGDATLYLIPEQRVGPVCFALLGCFKLNLLDQLSSADPSTHLHPRAQKFAHHPPTLPPISGCNNSFKKSSR